MDHRTDATTTARTATTPRAAIRPDAASTTAPPTHPQTERTGVLGRRIVAKLVDAIVATVLFAVGGGATALLLGAPIARGPAIAPLLAVGPLAMLGGSVLATAGTVGLEWAWAGRTLGKRLVGIRVVTTAGETPGFGAVLARNVFAAIDAAFVWLVGLVAIATSARNQRVGDRIAGTMVVRGRP